MNPRNLEEILKAAGNPVDITGGEPPRMGWVGVMRKQEEPACPQSRQQCWNSDFGQIPLAGS